MKSLSLLALLAIVRVATAQTSATGIPYFQQHVAYTLDASFHDDPESPSISGTGALAYTNNSPDTLHELYFHLYWNLFRNGSYGENAPNRDHSPEDDYGHGGIVVTKWSVSEGASTVGARVTVDNTIARLELERPLLPHAKCRIEFDWNGTLPNYGIRSTWGYHDRGARNFATAQWYPQICVYDNYGWHPDQYIGMGEFYSDYGSFDVTLKLPKRFSTIVSTGWQTNLKEVNPAYAERLQFARTHPDSVVRVADNSKAQLVPITASEPLVTWTFHADSVRDFAWAADEAYIWDAIYHNGIMHHALYWDGSRELWENQGAKITEFTISHNSRVAGQYLYPNAFLCETYEGGMEYPGIVFIGPYRDSSQHWAQNTMMHELGHQWYPMMMGSNETDYGYMDEGFNTFLTTLTHEAYFGRYDNQGRGSTSDERTDNYRAALVQQLSGFQEPTKQKADAYYSYRDYAEATYPHTGTALFMLRYTMGDMAFNDFLHLYYDRWHLKHPYPDDLLNAANDVERVEGDTNRVRARGDLRWFFDEWFDKTWTLDYAVDDFNVNGNTATVRIVRKGRAVMPLDLDFTLSDGTHVTKWIPVDDWLRTVADSREYSFDFSSRPVRVAINRTNELLDVNRLNNSSGWLPPIAWHIGFRNWLLGSDARPIDAYEVRMAPWVGPAASIDRSRNAITVGLTLLGSYVGERDRIAFGPRVEFGDKGNTDHGVTNVGGIFQYHNVIDQISPFSDIDVALASIGPLQLLTANYAHVVTREGDPQPVHIFGGGYALSGALFTPEGVPMNRLFGHYTYRFENSWDEFTLGGQFEAGVGDPRTTYSKLAGVINDRMDMGKSWELFLRGFAGSGTGTGPLSTMPADVQFNLGGASVADKFMDSYSSNLGSDVRSKIRNLAVSGPMVRAYHTLTGRSAISATAELNTYTLSPEHVLRLLASPFTHAYWPQMLDLSIFADAGVVGDDLSFSTAKNSIMSDFGLGVRFLGFGTRTDRDLHMDFNRMEFRLDVPLWMSNPDDGKPRWAPRLVGMVRQNF